MGKRASECAGLLFTTYCGHNPVNFTTQDVHSMDLTDPFDCDYRKTVLELDVVALFNLVFFVNLMNN